MMRSTMIAVTTAALLGAMAPVAQAAKHEGKITWAADPTQGFAEARREGKPIMIFFTADW